MCPFFATITISLCKKIHFYHTLSRAEKKVSWFKISILWYYNSTPSEHSLVAGHLTTVRTEGVRSVVGSGITKSQDCGLGFFNALYLSTDKIER
jgi:hypothetical protein